MAAGGIMMAVLAIGLAVGEFILRRWPENVDKLIAWVLHRRRKSNGR